MTLLKKLLKIAGILILIYIIAAFLGKDSYRVERKATINAPAKLVYTQISVFRNWPNWSPWQEKDPSVKNSYEGPDGDVGSVMKWVGDKNISGTGQIAIESLTPPSSMRYKLSFIVPFEMSSIGGFDLSEEPSGKTLVSWYDAGSIPFAMRPVMMFMNMDKQMGPDFERGLFKIDSVCSGMYQQMLKIMAQDSSSIAPVDSTAK